jgi:hypothetical protein
MSRAKSPRERDAHKRRLKTMRLRGLTVFQGKALLHSTKGACPICLNPFGKGRKGPHLDHDHVTGLARGYLCSKCNLAIGQLGDTAEAVGRAFAYLVNPPAARYRMKLKGGT